MVVPTSPTLHSSPSSHTAFPQALYSWREQVGAQILAYTHSTIAYTDDKATKILANLIVLGSGVVLRAVSQAYRQAIVNASKTGVAQETVQNMVHKSSKIMTLHEARQILGVGENASWEDVLKKYNNLFEKNAKTGSFYLQSKVQRAKECLETAREHDSRKGSLHD